MAKGRKIPPKRAPAYKRGKRKVKGPPSRRRRVKTVADTIAGIDISRERIRNSEAGKFMRQLLRAAGVNNIPENWEEAGQVGVAAGERLAPEYSKVGRDVLGPEYSSALIDPAKQAGEQQIDFDRMEKVAAVFSRLYDLIPDADDE